jgi:hypothetical protein
MTNPLQPETRPVWCSAPIKETIVIANPTTGEQKITKQLNIAVTPDSIIQSGFTQDTGLVQQDLNDQFNYIGRCIDYLMKSVNKPAVYATNELPAATSNIGKIVLISNIGSGTLAISNGTNWIKLTMGGNV